MWRVFPSKGWFGGHVSSVRLENTVKGLMFKVMIRSMFLSGGVGLVYGDG
ncbi:MAG: hypothetical protein N3D14_02320 [Aquificaceae bacterium]|nr:hypothetical protein [Aquificaceae bacterium]